MSRKHVKVREDYNEPPEIKKRLGGRYGGEPKKAIANPGNKEPAMSAKNEAVSRSSKWKKAKSFIEKERTIDDRMYRFLLTTLDALAPWTARSALPRPADFDVENDHRAYGKQKALQKIVGEAVANAKDDVTPEDSHKIEADLAKKPELDFVTHSQKMFEEMDDILGEAGPVGEVQKKLLQVLHGAGEGDHQLSVLARNPEFHRVHFGLIQRAASALQKKKLISYDGTSKVSLIEKGMNENTLVTEANIETTRYKGWPIYVLPTYTTPYYYPQRRYIKGKKVGGPTENYPLIKKVERLIDKWLKQMGLDVLNESESGLSPFDKIRVRSKVTIMDRFGKKRIGKAVIHNNQYDSWALNMGGRYGTTAIATRKNVVAVKEANVNEFGARPSAAKSLGSRASSKVMAAANKKITPVPVPEMHLDEAGPPDIGNPRGNDGYIIRIIQKAGSPEKALLFFDRASGSGGRKAIVANHAAARIRRYPKDFAKAVRKEDFGDFRNSNVHGIVNDEPLKLKDMVPEKLSEREADTFPVELLKTKMHNIKFSIRDMIKHLSKVESSFNEIGDEIRSIINTEDRRDRDLRKGQPSKFGTPSQPSVWSRESEQKTNRVRVAYNDLDRALKELKKEVGA